MSALSRLLLVTGSGGLIAVMLAELIIVVPPVPALTVTVRLRVALLEAAKPPTTHRPVVLL
jgi:biopolymer transport protein ExbD